MQRIASNPAAKQDETRLDAIRREWIGLALLLCAVGFNAYFLAPELRIGKIALNDSVFHLAAAERLSAHFSKREPFLDPWVSEWSLGYPVWRSYQPLGHLLAAVVLRITEPVATHAGAFAALQYLLTVLFPATVYAGTRLFGLSAPAAGLASLFVMAPSATGEAGRYGLGVGAITWRGTGLFTQLLALHLLVLSFGFVTRALDHGRNRVSAAFVLACTALSHLVFGYVAFVSSAVLAVIGPADQRARRVVRLAALAGLSLLLLAWFVVPLFFARHEINHSRWEAAFKWDSFGAPFVLKELFSGRLLDAGRPPILSFFLATSFAVACFSIRQTVPRRLVVLAMLWLVLFFGRNTWGHLLLLFGIPGDLHLHRFQAAFELVAMILAAWGVERLFAIINTRSRLFSVVAVVVVAIGTIRLGYERAGYLQQNRVWGEENLKAYAHDQRNLQSAFEEVRRIIAASPGRVSAGRANSWGRDFKIGSVPVYAFLTREHFDQVSFLYHAMSIPSDLMVLREEDKYIHDVVFGVRAIVAPAKQPMPAHYRLRWKHGMFAVYESSPEGYFGLVDIGSRYTGPVETAFEPSRDWLKSSLPQIGIVIALEGHIPEVPAVGRWQSFPAPSASFRLPRGQILSQQKIGETYLAQLDISRDCYAFIKVTWFPDLRATIDGVAVPLIRVTPGFAAVAVSAGKHELIVTYAPGVLKPLLFLVGLVLFGVCVWLLRSRRALVMEHSAEKRFRVLGARLARPQPITFLLIAFFVILSTRPLFRGQLINGHDALAYPPRLTSMAKAVSDGHIPPIWAAELSSGHGQPLFQFNAPLVPGSAVPFYMAGLRLTDSLQIALAMLFAAGAVAVYLVCRGQEFSSFASLATVATWLFAPYLSLDLFVRAAFAEASGVAVSPIALLALLRAIERPSVWRIISGSFAIALVALSHNAVAMIMVPIFALAVLSRCRTADHPIQTLLAGGATIVAGLGLSAYFWVPALMENHYVKTDLLRQGFLQWSNHSLSPRQLLWSKWDYGYSGPGADDGMSFSLGPLHIILAVCGFMIARRSRNRTQRMDAVTFAAFALAGALLATDWSTPIWKRFETLQYLAYPWRALIVPALFLPLLAVHVFEWLGPRKGLVVLTLLVAINLPHTEPKGYLVYDDEYYSPESIARKGINTATREVFEPRWVEVRQPYKTQRLMSSNNAIDVQNVMLKTARQEFQVETNADALVEANTFYYPGWIVTVNGKETSVSVVPQSGTMAFTIPKGKHRVVLELRPTPLRFWSRMITLATLGILIVAGVMYQRLKSFGFSKLARTQKVG